MKLIFSPLPVSSVKNHFEGCLDFVSAMELKSIILKCIAYKTNNSFSFYTLFSHKLKCRPLRNKVI